MRKEFAHDELMMPGHLACQGCGGTMIMNHALRAVGPDCVVVIPACCWTIISGNFPYTALNVPVLHTAFATSGAAASGVRAGLDMQGKHDTKVLAFAGELKRLRINATIRQPRGLGIDAGCGQLRSRFIAGSKSR